MSINPEADAIWQQTCQTIRTVEFYREDLANGALKLEVTVGDRSQTVIVRRSEPNPDWPGQQNWMIVESPFATVTEVDLRDVLGRTESFAICGLGQIGDMITIRDSLDLRRMKDDPAGSMTELGTVINEVGTLSDVFEGYFMQGVDRF